MRARLLTTLALVALAPALTTCRSAGPQGEAPAAETSRGAPSAEAPAAEARHHAHGEATAASATPVAPAASAHAGHRSMAATGAPAGDHSIYALPSTWTDQHGRTLELGDLAGRRQVVAMVYTHCTFACPRILAQMKQLEAVAAADVGFVLVSVDPDRDTPERLAEFARTTRLDPARWTLLTASEREIRQLSVLLGVPYRPAGDGEFAHANVLTLLDEGGVVVDRVEGLDADLSSLASRVGPAAEEPHAP